MKSGIDYIGVGVGGLLINPDDEVLLLRRLKPPESGCWTIPGGAVEFGECQSEALRREFLEELGVEIEVSRLLTVVDHIVKRDAMHFVASEYLVAIVSGEPRNLEPEKHSEIKWYRLDALPAELTQTAREAIEAHLETERCRSDQTCRCHISGNGR